MWMGYNQTFTIEISLVSVNINRQFVRYYGPKTQPEYYTCFFALLSVHTVGGSTALTGSTSAKLLPVLKHIS